MNTTTLLYVLATLVVLVVIGATFFPDRFRLVLSFLGLRAEVEGGRAAPDTPQGTPIDATGDGPGVVWKAEAEGSAGAQVAAGVGNDQTIGPPNADSTDEAKLDGALPNMRATAKDAPGAQVVAGVGNRQHRDDSAPADGEAPGKGE